MYSPPNLRTNIFMIGNLEAKICGNKLPSKLQVLKVLFFNIRKLKLTLRESASLVVSQVKFFWEKARLPTHQKSRCIDKVEALHKEWRNLNKHRKRPSNIEKERRFLISLKNLFDISHGNVSKLVDTQRMEFLENQRLDGRVGYITDLELDEFVKPTSTEETDQTSSQKTVGSYSKSSFDIGSKGEDEAGPSAPKNSRRDENLMTEKVVAVLDKCGVNDIDAVHLIAAIAEALEVDLQS